MQIERAHFILTVSPKDQQSWFYSLPLLPVKIPVRSPGGLRTIGEKGLRRRQLKLERLGKKRSYNSWLEWLLNLIIICIPSKCLMNILFQHYRITFVVRAWIWVTSFTPYSSDAPIGRHWICKCTFRKSDHRQSHARQEVKNKTWVGFGTGTGGDTLFIAHNMKVLNCSGL